jgi:hypothetical protein
MSRLVKTSVCTYEGIGTLTNPIVAPRAQETR